MRGWTGNRREWLRQAGVAASVAGVAGAAPRELRVRAFEPDGSAVKAERLKTLLLAGADGRPYELLPKPGEGGTATIELPKQKFEIMMILPVKDFGQVYLYADNAGALYPPQGRELLLNYEFSRSRAAFVRRYVKAAVSEGVSFSSAVTGRLARGEAALAKAADETDAARRAAWSNESLTETMWAGECAAVERARDRIGKQGPRPGFLFGCNAFGFAKSEEYARLYAATLNYATLPFYRASTEKVEGSPNYSAVEAILGRMAGTGILAKGHPLVWFHKAGIPEFLKKKSWEEIRSSARGYVLGSVGRFRARIHAWDVINEAHDWANELGFSQEQLLDLTRLASETTRVADPTAFRVVNSCCTWGEYVATGRSYFGVMRKPIRTPLEYLKALEAARVSYDAIGLQLYNPVRDMLEVERQLERFFVFGKPVHITELGVPSAPEVRSGDHANVWHGSAWSEQVQADWAEQFYTICYSKPQVQAITWWDFSDPAFIPTGGFLDKNHQPKESYRRLSKLIASWKS